MIHYDSQCVSNPVLGDSRMNTNDHLCSSVFISVHSCSLVTTSFQLFLSNGALHKNQSKSKTQPGMWRPQSHSVIMMSWELIENWCRESEGSPWKKKDIQMNGSLDNNIDESIKRKALSAIWPRVINHRAVIFPLYMWRQRRLSSLQHCRTASCDITPATGDNPEHTSWVACLQVENWALAL